MLAPALTRAAFVWFRWLVRSGDTAATEKRESDASSQDPVRSFAAPRVSRCQEFSSLLVLVVLATIGCDRRAAIRSDPTIVHVDDAALGNFECDLPTGSPGVFVLVTFNWFRGFYGSSPLLPQAVPAFEPRAEFNQYSNFATWRLGLQVQPTIAASVRQRPQTGEVLTWAWLHERDVTVYVTRSGEGRPFRSLDKPLTVTFSEEGTCCTVQNLLVAVHWSGRVRGRCAGGRVVVEGPADD